MSETALLETEALAVAVGGRLLFEDLTIAVERGQCWAIVGPNGAGKTSLLRTLAGLAPPQRGSIRYSGRALGSLALRDRARERSVLPQDSHDAFPATVLQTALIGRHPHLSRFAWESESDIAQARDALARFGLSGFEDRDVRTLSGGERRRAALASLLVQDTPLALLDEPSSHLDVAQQAAALDVFVNLARERGRALVMVLHDLHLATRFCDYAIAIGAGRVHAARAPEVLTAPSLSALFRRPLAELSGDGLRTFVPTAIVAPAKAGAQLL
jgi:iron complex transport system ATP-binding protein